MNNFKNKLTNKLVSSLNKTFYLHEDPWYTKHKYSVRKELKRSSLRRKIIRKVKDYVVSKQTFENVIQLILNNSNLVESFNYLYNILDNSQSKKLLLELAALRILGSTHVRLSIENSDYLEYHNKAREANSQEPAITLPFKNWTLNLYNFKLEGRDVSCYYIDMGIVTTFFVEQYSYPKEGVVVEDGDYVIDGGGCWGDTAIYFSKKVNNAKVFSFEFIPSNMELFKQNISLNSDLDVTLVPNALSNKSGELYYVEDQGPASSISIRKEERADIEVYSMAIDDFVQKENLHKIDFIKLDIEGAELRTLEGAVETIKRFKPKLAVALYHHVDDFQSIPKFINDLSLGYKFYIGHYTPGTAETILFAKV